METCLQAVLTPENGVRLIEAEHPGDPRTSELLLAMRFAPINPADRLIIAGRYSFQPSEIAVVGAEGVGEVIALDKGAEGFAIGDLVIPLERGNWARFRRVSADAVVRVPAGLPIEQAAMLRINPATAWRLLSTAPLHAGDAVIQNGGRSAVAGLVEQIAGSRGIALLSVSRNADVPTQMLVDGPDLAQRSRAAVDKSPIRLALDCVGGEATGRLAACLEDGGRLTVFGHLSGEPCQIPSILLTGRGLTLSGFSLRLAEAGDSISELRRLYGELAGLLIKQPLPVAEIRPLSRLDEALAAAPSGNGRILLDLQR
ncbi:MAG: zinc-dependent alcohol dehydrogenase family protein [Sphingomicrobium sp.]